MARSDRILEVPALVVRQWLDAWDNLAFESSRHRKKPKPYFYIFALSAKHLRALTGFQTRTTAGRKSGKVDLGIQRRHETLRSEEIHDFVQFGFPWSSLTISKRKSGEFDDMRKPGWLPTAIVVNILETQDRRRGVGVTQKDLITVTQGKDGRATIQLPKALSAQDVLPPIEVIDGQHRLWAFEDTEFGSDFQLPVVAFHGLDVSWQAYLFWTINVKPKRINASLAYDLYPLLRSEDWLERAEEHFIYRETRAQELVTLLWQHPASPWQNRINMLGEPTAKRSTVSQAAYVRSLVASFVKSWEGRRIQIGGLFGGRTDDADMSLGWSRPQQAAFLIQSWISMRDAIQECKEPWARKIRSAKIDPDSMFDPKDDPAFFGPHSLFRTDVGVRGFLSIINDMCFQESDRLGLRDWLGNNKGAQDDISAVDQALKELRRMPVLRYLSEICNGLCRYDWRTSSADLSDVSETGRVAKLALRGSGGYKELRRQLLNQLLRVNGRVGTVARDVKSILGYE